MGKNSCKITIHSGEKFSKLTSIKYEFTKVYGKSNYQYYWLFKCDCGKEIVVSKNSVLRGLTQSCGCYKSEVSSETFKKINKDLKPELTIGPLNRLYSNYKHGAESRNYCFELTKEQFKSIVLKNCYYCNRLPEQKTFNKTRTDHVFNNGIDRVNNSLGYTMNNIVPCCKHCNRAKMSLSEDQFVQLIKDIYKNLNLSGGK